MDRSTIFIPAILFFLFNMLLLSGWFGDGKGWKLSYPGWKLAGGTIPIPYVQELFSI